MNHRERLKAVWRYEDYDRLPLVHFGFWLETIEEWVQQGHFPQSYLDEIRENPFLWCGTEIERKIESEFGFDYNIFTVLGNPGNFAFYPPFEPKVVKEFPDGLRHVLNPEGCIVAEKLDENGHPLNCIGQHVGHTLVDRASWEEIYKPRYKVTKDRFQAVQARLDEALAEAPTRERPLGLFVTSLGGQLRTIMGFENFICMWAEDDELMEEIVQTTADAVFEITKLFLENANFDPDYLWFGEDIAFKNGPMISPAMFRDIWGPNYKRITDYAKTKGIDFTIVDCDGLIDTLVPTWVNNGVNVMLPCEVGTWNGNIAPWRQAVGKDVRCVGGMNKTCLMKDKKAVDAEIERLKPLVDMGGFIPMPDHQIAPGSKFELVMYYCEQYRKAFG